MWKHPASSFTTALLILPFIITSLTRMNHSNLLLSGPEIHYAAILNLVWHWCTPVKFNFGHVGLTLNNVSVTFLLSLQIILIISNCSERLWAEELLAKGGRFLRWDSGLGGGWPPYQQRVMAVRHKPLWLAAANQTGDAVANPVLWSLQAQDQSTSTFTSCSITAVCLFPFPLMCYKVKQIQVAVWC